MQQKNQVFVQSLIWSQENHGLFDYEAKDLKGQSNKLFGTKSIYCKNNVITFSDKDGDDMIGKIIIEQDGAYFQTNQKQSDAYLKLSTNLKYRLQAGDLFKLGRMEYFVSEIYTEDDIILRAPNHFNLDKHINVDKDTAKQCKFCLMEDNEEKDNPYLGELCKCQGHSQYVHVNCLKDWINFGNRIRVRETLNTVQYEWDKALECDVCKELIPSRVYLNKDPSPLNLINVERLPLPYIILEQITRQQNLAKSLTLIHSANQKPIHIGRGHNCEIRCQDISVSRNHACIVFEDGWSIFDLNSKFGTLQIIHDKIKLSEEMKEIQIGKILLKIQMEICA